VSDRDFAEVRVRDAVIGDVPAILALWEAARSPIASTPDDVAAIEQLISRHSSSLLVAEIERELVGAIVAAWDGWRGNMYRLAVAERQRRRGIGRRLVAAGHERLRSKGAVRVTALVGRDEPEAKKLWLSAGYTEDLEIVRFVRNL
jgi:ribosomal protein S18 acetylase RimI-like enzyme